MGKKASVHGGLTVCGQSSHSLSLSCRDWTSDNKHWTLNNEPAASPRWTIHEQCTLNILHWTLNNECAVSHWAWALSNNTWMATLPRATLLCCSWESEHRGGSITLRSTLSCLSNVSKWSFDYTAEFTGGFFITRNTIHIYTSGALPCIHILICYERFMFNVMQLLHRDWKQNTFILL